MGSLLGGGTSVMVTISRKVGLTSKECMYRLKDIKSCISTFKRGRLRKATACLTGFLTTRYKYGAETIRLSALREDTSRVTSEISVSRTFVMNNTTIGTTSRNSANGVIIVSHISSSPCVTTANVCSMREVTGRRGLIPER